MPVLLIDRQKPQPDQQIIKALRAILEKAESGTLQSVAVAFDDGEQIDSFMQIAIGDEWACYRVLSMLMGAMIDGN